MKKIQIIAVVIIIIALTSLVWFWISRQSGGLSAPSTATTPATTATPAGTTNVTGPTTADLMKKEIPKEDAARVQTVTGISSSTKGFTPLLSGQTIVGVATGTPPVAPTGGNVPPPIIVGPSPESSAHGPAEPSR